MKSARFSVAGLSTVLLFFAGNFLVVRGQIVRAPNGHFYQAIVDPGIDWVSANESAGLILRCESPGHLVTITSEDEDLFIEELRAAVAADFGLAGGPEEFYVGGFQSPGQTDPTNGWQWVNGEGLISGINGGATYSNWYPDGVLCCGAEPNDCCGTPGEEDGEEDFLGVGIFGLFGWNDEGSTGNIGGYFVEWDVDPTVVIGGCDSDVSNVVVDDATLCTLSDLIAKCADEVANHGQFVSCVAQLTNDWVSKELISGREKAAIQKCAAHAAIP